jgi:hypothetical protein
MKKKYDLNRQSHLLDNGTLSSSRHAVRNAKKRGREWTIPEDMFWELVSGPCHYCGGPCGVYGCGLDRKDNDKGYTPENSVACCKRCNYTKGYYYTYAEMMRLSVVIRELDAERAANVNSSTDTSTPTVEESH